MESSSPMKLVFRMSGVGFSLSIGNLVEIREFDADEFSSVKDNSQGDCLGDLSLPGRKISVFDLASALHLDAAPICAFFLVLCGEMGEWALLVDAIEGIFPARDFVPQTVSGLVASPVTSPYEYVDIWHDQVLVQCDVPRLESCRERSL